MMCDFQGRCMFVSQGSGDVLLQLALVELLRADRRPSWCCLTSMWYVEPASAWCMAGEIRVQRFPWWSSQGSVSTLRRASGMFHDFVGWFEAVPAVYVREGDQTRTVWSLTGGRERSMTSFALP